jgi:hypothetical protein
MFFIEQAANFKGGCQLHKRYIFFFPEFSLSRLRIQVPELAMARVAAFFVEMIPRSRGSS